MTQIQMKPDINRLYERLKRSHSVLSRHPETCLYGGVMLMGDSMILDKPLPYTACTDGRNKFYGTEFMAALSNEEINAVVLHENLHVALRHIPRFAKLAKKYPKPMNMAMDYVVNGIIMRMKDTTLCKLPEGGCYDQKYDGWSVIEVFEDLMKNQPQAKPQGGKDQQGDQQGDASGESDQSGGGFDKHDIDGYEALSEAEAKKLVEELAEALQAGSIIAGRVGANIPREIDESAQAEEDWKQVLADFVADATRGQDEYTWSRMNRRWLASDMYRPSVISEAIGEVVIGIDTSGSIGGSILSRFAAELASICESCNPEKVRILWWDTRVHGEQVFDDRSYGDIRKLLKPVGGGGTSPQCVDTYIQDNGIHAQCLVMLTDGCFDTPQWTGMTPTLWFVLGRASAIPAGHRVVRSDRGQFD